MVSSVYLKESKEWRNVHRRTILALLSAFIVTFGFETTGWAQENKDPEKGNQKGLVYNVSGKEIGSVDGEGIVYNRYGKSLGSVDTEGSVYNISKIIVGKVDRRGEVRNQTGTLLGFVEQKGIVYNRSQTKMGSVEGIDNIFLMGGAARLLLFKTR